MFGNTKVIHSQTIEPGMFVRWNSSYKMIVDVIKTFENLIFKFADGSSHEVRYNTAVIVRVD